MSYEKFCTGCEKTFPADATSCPHCGAACANNNPGGTLPEGIYLVERYVIGKVLDVDGEGILYEAIDQQSGLPVLIKEYLPVTLCSKRDDEGNVVVKQGSEVPYKTTLVDFVDLYKNLKELQPLRGLAKVEALFKANNTVYAVLEYTKSVSLNNWLNRQTELLSFERCYDLLEPVCAGLTTLHGAGIIHRGVCPDNIRITPDGRSFLTGYGTLALRSLNSELKPCLYEGYSAPEQYSTTEFQGPYTDVYSLAAVFYKMLAGTAPVATAGRLDGCPTLRQIGADVPAAISKAVDRAMWGDVKQRTQTVAEFQSELIGEPVGEMEATRVMNPVASPKKKAPAAEKTLFDNKPLLIGGCVALGLVVVMIIWLLIRGMVPVRGSSSQTSSMDSSSEQSSSLTSSVEATPSPTPESETETVPNFKGQSYSQIAGNGTYQQKYIFNVTESYSDNVAAGVVISQSPIAGAELPSDNRIDLVVSKGPQYVTVPQYLNLTSSDVISLLTGVGIPRNRIEIIEVENDGTQVQGLSVGGNPEPGATFNLESDTITIYMAGAPTQTDEPESVPSTGSESSSTVTTE